jgi:multidrug efflux pump subunit AcrA (membrane-fusion protein)
MPRSASFAASILRSVAPPAVLLGGVGVALALAMSREPPKPREAETVAPLVETAVVSQKEGGLEITADGVVVPFRSISLASEVEGRVVEKSENCREGKSVKAGEVLLKIDPSDYELQIARLERERDQTQANLAELAVQIANAASSIELAKEEVQLHQDELNRLETGAKRGAVTPQVYDAARRAELTSRTALVKLENDKRLLEAQGTRWQEAVKLVETQLKQARLNLDRATIKSPADGVIVSTKVEQDGYLKKGDVIASLEDTAAVEVRTNLEMRVIAWLRAHLPIEAQSTLGPYDLPPVPVTVTYEVLGNTYSWHGTLARVEGIGVDERTRTVRCRVHVERPRDVSLQAGSADLPIAAPPALVSGMYVKVMLHAASSDPLLSVPEQAVRPGNAVWAVRDGKLARFELPAARVTRGAVLVAPQVTKLKPGDLVVVSPLPVAEEGLAVRVSEEKPATKTPSPAPETRTAVDRHEARR